MTGKSLNENKRISSVYDENLDTSTFRKVTTKSSDLTTIKIVTQRVSRGKLLINETNDEWVTFGPGLIFHVSFTKICAQDKNFRQICKSLVNSNLTTSGQWRPDHGDADSVLGLCKKGMCLYIFVIKALCYVTNMNKMQTFCKSS